MLQRPLPTLRRIMAARPERIVVLNHANVRAALAVCVLFMLAACATESQRVVPTANVATYATSYNGPRYASLFSDGADRLGSQAKTILKTHLQQTNRFTVVDRDNMAAIAQEAAIRGQAQSLKGAQVAITGDVTEFGRKTTGDMQLFGILGAGKKQVAYAKVALNVVDVTTSELIYSVQGAGEFALSDRQVVGFGSTAGYDATLNGKVLNLAITEAVNQLTAAMENGAWSPTGS